MLLVIFILPFYSFESYSILKNTTSQLGGQKTPNSWIMNAVFIGLGLSSVLSTLPRLNGFILHKVLITIFGISLFMTAFYSHAPIVQDIPYDAKEDQIHSLLATMTGFSFTAFAVSMAFILRESRQKIMAVSIATVDTFLSVVMFDWTEYTGLCQRAIFILSFAWLLYITSYKSGILRGS